MTRIPFFNPYQCEPEETLANWAEQLNEIFSPPYITNNIENVYYEQSPGYWIRFELTSTFTSGVASASVLDPGGSAYSPGQTINVKDVLGTYTGAAGTERGYAYVQALDPDNLVHEIVRLGGMGGGAAIDNYTVKVSADDTTPGYLFAKLKDAATYVAGADLLVAAEETDGAGDENVRLFADVSVITGYHASDAKILQLSGGAVSWVTPGGGSADGNDKVRVSSDDTTTDYLINKFKDTAAIATYVSTQDLLVHAAETDGAGDESVRAFIDSSLITGFSGTGDHYLTMDDGVVKWTAKPASSGFLPTLAKVTATVSAATLSGTAVDPGTGTIKKFTRPGTAGNNWTLIDSPVTAWNNYFDSFPVDTIVWVDDENYVVGAGCTLLG